MGCKPFNSVSKILTTLSWGGRGGVNSLTKIFILMNINNNKILDIIDTKYDIDIEDYFKLSEESKIELTELLTQSLINNSQQNPIILHSYIISINKLIGRSLQEEDYERCDMFSRIEKKLMSLL